MKIDQELSSFFVPGGSILTVGVFDGVHKGHRHLISKLIGEGVQSGLPTGVITFQNHPASILNPDFKPIYLTDIQERLRLIKKLGVDFVAPITFSLELSKMSAHTFSTLLKKHLNMKRIIVGSDFAMGHNRETGVSQLTSIGEKMCFSVTIVPSLLEKNGTPIKSTSIREALSHGDVDRITALLGRNFLMTGVVIRGDGRGKYLGFPTANLKPTEEIACMADGIYATWAYINSQKYMSATSIGKRPTFEGREHTIETFILGLEDNLYGEKVQLEFVSRLRDEKWFRTEHELKNQISEDVKNVRIILKTKAT